MSVENGEGPRIKGTGMPGKMQEEGRGCYDDILYLPHPVSRVHPQMDRLSRAAQFSPFAALSGYEDAIRETGRLTEERVVLCEDEKELLDEKLRQIRAQIAQRPKVTITYFVPDARKEGGTCRSVTGTVRRIDGIGQRVVLQDGREIPMDDIVRLEVGESVCRNLRGERKENDDG